MTGLVVLVLAVAIPLGIVLLTVFATESERNVYSHAPVSRLATSIAFSAAALIGLAIVFRGTGTEYALAFTPMLALPTAIIAAVLAAVAHRLLVGRSRLIAAISGVVIALLTALGVSTLFAVISTPDQGAAMFIASIGPLVLLLPNGFPALFVGGLAGFLLSHFSNRKRPNPPLNTDAPPNGGAPVS